MSKIQKNTFFIIIGLFIILIFEKVNIFNDLSFDENLALRMVFLMIFLWITELIPISITALIPLIFSPFYLDQINNDIFSKYASPVVFLLLGGFIIANGFEKSQLHKRVALKILLSFGNTRKKILLCIIFSTSIFSMFLSNTATCLLMLPIVKNIVDSSFAKLSEIDFSKILLLSIAYSASIGGMATPIGTIPNAVLVGYLNENHNLQIDFVDWFLFSFPLTLLLLSILFIFLSKRFIDDKKIIKVDYLKVKYEKLGRLSDNEKITIFILSITISLWIFKNSINEIFQLHLSDSIIAIFGSLLFFIIPNKKFSTILNFDWYKNVPWNVLILFGGGLAMASIIISSGLAEEIAKLIDSFSNLNLLSTIIIVAVMTSLLTEFTSNTATTFLLLPILSLFAINNDIEILKLALPFVFAASCAFMMPIATPPNAIVYSVNKFKISFMVYNGFFVNLISVMLISIYIFSFNF
ncbi:MAG: SLC13 family permease [Alphaproteobacteria bacterium]